jgi:predicted nucleotidyltransferase
MESLLFRISDSLPSSNTAVAVECALEKLRQLFDNKYTVQLHGSWFLDLAFDKSDIDVAVIVSQQHFNIVTLDLQNKLKNKKKFQCFSIKGRLVTNADMKVIPMIYDTGTRENGKICQLEIDLTMQSAGRLEPIFHLREAVTQYEFHDLYRSIKIILRDNHLYGHKVGGLNSFSIGWMIVAMIEFYKSNSNLLEIRPDWFGRIEDNGHLHVLVAMFCEFYINIHHCNISPKLRIIDSDRKLIFVPIQLNFDNWKDVKQPWLLRLYLNDTWISGKSWRYNYILALFQKIVDESKSVQS